MLKIFVALHLLELPWEEGLAVTACILPLAFWILYFRRQADEKAFGLKALSKLSLPMFLGYLFYSACDQLENVDEQRQCDNDRIVKILVIDNLLYALAIFLMVIPVQRLTATGFGRQVVKTVMARGFCDVFSKRQKASDQEMNVKARLETRLSKRTISTRAGSSSSTMSTASWTSSDAADVDLEANASVGVSVLTTSTTFETQSSECSSSWGGCHASA